MINLRISPYDLFLDVERSNAAAHSCTKSSTLSRSALRMRFSEIGDRVRERLIKSLKRMREVAAKLKPPAPIDFAPVAGL